MAQTKIANNQLQLDVSKNYTQDNLIAGKSMEIAEYVNPYVIDSNTLLCCHFDENLVDEVSGNAAFTQDAAVFSTTYKKFGSASFVQSKALQFVNQLTIGGSNWTVEAWVRSADSDGSVFWLTGDGGSLNNRNFYIKKSPSTGSTVFNKPISSIPNDKNWHHIAFCKAETGDNLYYFIDGVLKNTVSVSASSLSSSFKLTQFYSINSNIQMDELRISNVCRWTEDFEVPDAPYEPASSSNPMAINAIVDTALSSTSKNPVQNKVIDTALNGKQAVLTSATGYDATKTQVLKNINGVLTWVDEA